MIYPEYIELLDENISDSGRPSETADVSAGSSSYAAEHCATGGLSNGYSGRLGKGI